MKKTKKDPKNQVVETKQVCMRTGRPYVKRRTTKKPKTK